MLVLSLAWQSSQHAQDGLTAFVLHLTWDIYSCEHACFCNLVMLGTFQDLTLQISEAGLGSAALV